MTAMTMDDIKAMTCNWITPSVAARVMKMDPGRLIEYARIDQLPDPNNERTHLPFKTRVSGDRVLVYRKSFIAAYEPEPEEKKPDHLTEIVKELHQQNIALTSMNMILFTALKSFVPEITIDAIAGGMKQ